MASSIATTSTSRYGLLDRLLHSIAFVHPRLQRVLADIESDLFKSRLQNVAIKRPVFITGLPRAGTTLILELLYSSGEFASYTYRQMPFVLSPLLWDRLSASSQQSARSEDRAHGDGMKISYDSPEAFEEVVWKNYLHEIIFSENGMQPVAAEQLSPAFRQAFSTLQRKIICLAGNRSASAATQLRYLSKNNANIARLNAVASLCPDAIILCCFRHPATQVVSLNEQHQRFLKMHASDVFAKRYMAWSGHHDFGANFRPVQFSERSSSQEHNHLFWLQYWIDAYRYALEHAPANVKFLCFESLLEDGEVALQQLADTVGLRANCNLESRADQLRKPGSKAVVLQSVSSLLSKQADELYEQLRQRSIQ